MQFYDFLTTKPTHCEDPRDKRGRCSHSAITTTSNTTTSTTTAKSLPRLGCSGKRSHRTTLECNSDCESVPASVAESAVQIVKKLKFQKDRVQCCRPPSLLAATEASTLYDAAPAARCKPPKSTAVTDSKTENTDNDCCAFHAPGVSITTVFMTSSIFSSIPTQC